MEHRNEVHSFIAQVKTLAVTPEAVLLMSIAGVGEALARCCAAVDHATNFGLSPDERMFIMEEIAAWMHRVERGEECACGKCHTTPEKKDAEPVAINSAPVQGMN